MTFSLLGLDTQTGKRVEISQSARRQGLYIIGANGTGKTGLIENLIVQDIEQGLGVAVLDPHGDLTNNVLARMPENRLQDVILLDITDEEYTFGLNLFRCDNPTSSIAVQYIVDQVMHIFEKLFDTSRAGTPLLLQYLRNCTQILIANPGFTMADIPLLLTEKQCRQKLVAKVKNLQVKRFWQNYDRMSPKDQQEEWASLERRIDEFLQPLAYNIVGQSKTTINLRQMMDERKILLLTLSPRLDSISSLIGSIIIALLLNAAYSRSDIEQKRRKQFNIYADEFQRFATEDFATLLTEARKFGIATTIGHQTLSQISEKNRAAALQAGNLVVFKVTGPDSQELASNFDCTPPPIKERAMAVPQQVVHALVSMNRSHKNPQVNGLVTALLVPLVNNLDTTIQIDKGRSYTPGYSRKVEPSGAEIEQARKEQLGRMGRASYPQPHYEWVPGSGGTYDTTGRLRETLHLVNALLYDVMIGKVTPASSYFQERLLAIIQKKFSYTISSSQKFFEEPLMPEEPFPFSGKSWKQAFCLLATITPDLLPREVSMSVHVADELSLLSDAKRKQIEQAERERVQREVVTRIREFHEHARQICAWYAKNSPGEKPTVPSESLKGNEPDLYDEGRRIKLKFESSMRDAEKDATIKKMLGVYSYHVDYFSNREAWGILMEAIEEYVCHTKDFLIQGRYLPLPNKSPSEREQIHNALVKRLGEIDFEQYYQGFSSATVRRIIVSVSLDALKRQEITHKLQEGFSPATIDKLSEVILWAEALYALCELLSQEENKIKVPVDYERVEPRRTYADMQNEIASNIANVPKYTARVKIVQDEATVEHTIRTQEPAYGVRRNIVEDRKRMIRTCNINDGYLRKLNNIEEEILQRQLACLDSPPPQERFRPERDV